MSSVLLISIGVLAGSEEGEGRRRGSSDVLYQVGGGLR